jgi:hypothetical protein
LAQKTPKKDGRKVNLGKMLVPPQKPTVAKENTDAKKDGK